MDTYSPVHPTTVDEILEADAAGRRAAVAALAA
jgi:hypothetical protein